MANSGLTIPLLISLLVFVNSGIALNIRWIRDFCECIACCDCDVECELDCVKEFRKYWLEGKCPFRTTTVEPPTDEPTKITAEEIKISGSTETTPIPSASEKVNNRTESTVLPSTESEPEESVESTAIPSTEKTVVGSAESTVLPSTESEPEEPEEPTDILSTEEAIDESPAPSPEPLLVSESSPELQTETAAILPTVSAKSKTTAAAY
ncbi:hypothetical protein Aperf_G00000076305 [Anoplocephala perfoliata]